LKWKWTWDAGTTSEPAKWSDRAMMAIGLSFDLRLAAMLAEKALARSGFLCLLLSIVCYFSAKARSHKVIERNLLHACSHVFITTAHLIFLAVLD
jgi:hypothetical protein